MNIKRPFDIVPTASAFRQPRSMAERMMWVVAVCGLVTVLIWPLRDALDPANTAMLYLLAVAFVAMRAGRQAAFAAAFLSTGLLDFFFIYPRFTFTVGDVQYVVTLAVMLAVALIIGNLTTVLQRQATEAIERERQSHALYQLASRLAGITSLEQIASATRDFLQQARDCRSILMMDRDGTLQPVEQVHRLITEKQSAAAFTALQQAQTRHMQE